MSSDVQNEFFHCTLCDFKIRYDYKGNNPPFFKKEIKFLESVYCIRDPFADDNLGGIILGGDCSTCGKSVCVSQFYEETSIILFRNVNYPSSIIDFMFIKIKGNSIHGVTTAYNTKQ
ncbi:hypothetical protein KSF78_0005014 [Schistosoma japonicum]|nr:hypothetical protein KSF78_0005014 [Schistosoma japonicum]